MSGGYLTEAAVFLVSAIFGIVAVVLILRFLLQLVGANFYNPVCQTLYRVTNPLVMPLRRVVPGLRGWDLATLLLVWLVQCLKMAIIVMLYGRMPSLLGTPLLGFAELIGLVIWVFIIATIARIVLSFLTVDNRNPLVPLLYQLTEPLLKPLRGRLSGAGIDFSPMVVLIGLGLMLILIHRPLLDLGLRL